MMQSTVRYFDGVSSRAQAVTLEIKGDFLILLQEDGEEKGRWPLDQLRDENVPPSSERLNLSVDMDNPARILVDDYALIQHLLNACPNLQKRRKQPSGWWRPYALGGGAAVISVVVFFMFGLPYLASTVANMVPAETREQIGSTIEKHMIQTFSKESEGEAVCTSVAGQAALEKLIGQFREASGHDMPAIPVTVVKSKVANAFALPGGRMIILSSLIDKADNPNALAGIIAHEFGHIEGKHPTRLFVANIGVAAILSLALGDVTGGTIIAGVGQMALGAAYSREFERYADSRAIDLMSYWKFDMSPSITFLESLDGPKENTPGFFSFFASHPDTADRVDQLRAAGNTGEGDALTNQEWQAIKVICSKSI